MLPAGLSQGSTPVSGQVRRYRNLPPNRLGVDGERVSGEGGGGAGAEIEERAGGAVGFDDLLGSGGQVSDTLTPIKELHVCVGGLRLFDLAL